MEDCLDHERAELSRLYEREIFPVLTPLGVGPGQPFPYISGLSLSLAVLARDPDTGEARFARVKVPEQLPRFVSVGDGRMLIPVEDVIGHYLDWLFPGWRSSSAPASASRATPTWNSPTTPTTCSRPSRPRFASAVSAMSCASRWRRRCRRAWSSSCAPAFA